MKNAAIFAALVYVLLGSCQPATDAHKPKREFHQPVVLDYTLLGIWPERYQAYEIGNALEVAGIRSKLSGVRPCLINVETAKLSQAQSFVMAHPSWQQKRIR
ncbi:MAG: hypothetical protein ACO3SO_05745 [Luteolibacter sp.]